MAKMTDRVSRVDDSSEITNAACPFIAFFGSADFRPTRIVRVSRKGYNSVRVSMKIMRYIIENGDQEISKHESSAKSLR